MFKSGKTNKNSDASSRNPFETDSEGIAARVRARNQNKSRPDYEETPFKQYHRLASEFSDSETSSASTPRTMQNTYRKMIGYEDDAKFLPPSPSKHKSINLRSLLREKKPISNTAPIEIK